PVWVTDPRTVADGLRLIRELGEVTGTRQRAEEILRQLEPLYERVRAAAAGRAPVAVFYAIWRDPYMTVGADTYVHDMLTVCGGRNVFGDRPERYPTVTLDEVAARRPAVIRLPDEPFRFRRVHVKDFARYADVPAVRDGRIHLVDGKPFSWHGPRIAEALRTIPPLLHGSALALLAHGQELVEPRRQRSEEHPRDRDSRDEPDDHKEDERDEGAEQVEERGHGASGDSTSLDL